MHTIVTVFTCTWSILTTINMLEFIYVSGGHKIIYFTYKNVLFAEYYSSMVLS